MVGELRGEARWVSCVASAVAVRTFCPPCKMMWKLFFRLDSAVWVRLSAASSFISSCRPRGSASALSSSCESTMVYRPMSQTTPRVSTTAHGCFPELQTYWSLAAALLVLYGWVSLMGRPIVLTIRPLDQCVAERMPTRTKRGTLFALLHPEQPPRYGPAEEAAVQLETQVIVLRYSVLA